MVPKISCSNCEQQIWTTQSNYPVRCPYCDHVNVVNARKETKTIQDVVSKIKLSVIRPFTGASASYPTKRAVLCGVTYKENRKAKLKGTVNDVNIMQDLLVNHFKFSIDNIRVLTEEARDSSLIPTKKNIIDSLFWLVEGNKRGDSLVFYFSGHGTRLRESDGDENDGFDEAICPVDDMTEGVIFDDDINSIIVRPLKKGVILHAIVDSCHSGTIMDLTCVYDHLRKKWIDDSPPSGAQKGTSGGLAICLSACQDDQMANETSAFSKAKNGVMTYLLVQALKSNPIITYGQLIGHMHMDIEEVNGNQNQGRRARLLRKIFSQHYFEFPQLSASKNFDVYEREFML